MIQAKNLGKEFHGKWIFQFLNLEVRPQESIVIMGPSGSGKSIFLKILAGLLEPSEGSVQSQNQNIGMLFQKNALFDSFTVQENLIFPLTERLKMKRSKAREKASRFLAHVGLSGFEKLYPDEISGGMQKRLGIARALIVEPEVILYDEPTAGLDPLTSKTIAELIKKLQKEVGSTIITVTNEVQRAYQLADRIFLLAQGKLILGGTPDEVKNTTIPELHQFIYGLKKGPLTPQFVLHASTEKERSSNL